MSPAPTERRRIPLEAATPSGAGTTSALLARPDEAWSLLVLGHSAGAGMDHPHLQRLAERFADRGIATLRYQFPYMDEGRRRPDRPSVLEGTVRAAVSHAGALEPALPQFAGGRSMGGRMTSRAAADRPLPGVHGLVFFAYPLHPPARVADPDPPLTRADHLESVTTPMLFLQGTRDRLARLPLLRRVLDRLGERADLHLIDQADHAFAVPKRTGRTPDDIEGELVEVTARWCRARLGAPGLDPGHAPHEPAKE